MLIQGKKKQKPNIVWLLLSIHLPDWYWGGYFLLSHFCLSAKVSKMLLITKTVPDGGKSNYKEGKKNTKKSKNKKNQRNKMGEWKRRFMFFFPWMSVHYQPDTITSRVITLQSLKYQNKRKAAHKQRQKQKP